MIRRARTGLFLFFVFDLWYFREQVYYNCIANSSVVAKNFMTNLYWFPPYQEIHHLTITSNLYCSFSSLMLNEPNMVHGFTVAD